MEVTTDLSEKIVDTIQEFVLYFANQELSFYASILIIVAICAFTVVHIVSSISLIKECYNNVEHPHFKKINIKNLLSVILFSMINMNLSALLNLYFATFAIPIMVWFVFMLKLFILNLKMHKTKIEIMKKEKQQYDLDKQIGTMSRVTQDELYVDFQKDGKYYKEFEISEFREEPRKRLNNDTLFNRKD